MARTTQQIAEQTVAFLSAEGSRDYLNWSELREMVRHGFSWRSIERDIARMLLIDKGSPMFTGSLHFGDHDYRVLHALKRIAEDETGLAVLIDADAENLGEGGPFKAGYEELSRQREQPPLKRLDQAIVQKLANEIISEKPEIVRFVNMMKLHNERQGLLPPDEQRRISGYWLTAALAQVLANNISELGRFDLDYAVFKVSLTLLRGDLD